MTFVLQTIIKTILMNLLFSQVASNTPDESVLMVIAVAACLISLTLLLWKNNAKSAS